jgi:hypothetical protein
VSSLSATYGPRRPRRTTILGIAISSGLFLAGCGGPKYQYPDPSVFAFMSSCTSAPGASRSECECSIEKLQEEVPFAEFEREDRELARGGQATRILATVEECRED